MLNRLFPFLGKKDDTPEKTEEELKAERIKFHRQSVRNGPVKFRTLTNGQVRRMQKRDLLNQQKKSHRQARSNHWQGRQEAARLRAFLQGAGVVPYVTGINPSDETRDKAYRWLIGNYADEIETDDDGIITTQTVENALYNAWKRYSDLTGQEQQPRAIPVQP